MAKLMGIRPWEIDLLTYDQFERSIAAIDHYYKSEGGSDSLMDD